MPDHAKKGRPRKPVKGRGGKGKQAAQAPKPRLWLMLIAVLAICAGFGYFLFYIDGSAENPPVNVVKSATPAPTNSRPLPKAPTESWQYEKLDQKEIAIDLPQHPEATHQYRLQCGSFKTLPQADSMKAKIAFQGFESLIKKVKGKSGYWYQVYLGPFERKRSAEAARHKMQRAGLNYCQIYFWQG